MSLSIIDCILLLFLAIFLIMSYYYHRKLGFLIAIIIWGFISVYEGKYLLASSQLVLVIILAIEFYTKYYKKTTL